MDRFYGHVFTLLAALLLAWLSFLVLAPVGAPLLAAALIGFLLWPLNLRARRLFRGRDGAAAIALTLGALAGIAAPATWLGTAFVRQASELVRGLPTAAEALRSPLALRIGGWLQRLPIDLDEVRQRALGGVASALQFTVSRLGTVFVGAVGAATGLALTVFILFFALRDGDRIVKYMLALVPVEEATKQRLFTHIGVVTRAVVVGSLATAAAQGTLVGIAFAILGLPSPIVFGVISAVVSVLPIGGTALVWGPAALVLGLAGRIGAAVFLVVWGVLVVSVVDNLIRPRIVSGRADVPTLMVFLGLVGGIASFGLVGLFAGPIVLVTTLEVARLLAADHAGGAARRPRSRLRSRRGEGPRGAAERCARFSRACRHGGGSRRRG